MTLGKNSTACLSRMYSTHPGVAKSHADGGVDGHAEVALGLLHVQSVIGGYASRCCRAAEQQEEEAGEHGNVHLQLESEARGHLAQDENIKGCQFSVRICSLSSAPPA